MPQIDLIDPVYYGPNDPYHYYYDNLPLRNIIQRQTLINLALDNVIGDMTDAVGSQGSVANRLSQSIADDGSLKVAAIDDALHSIEAHTDSDTYVRMQKAESDKLTLIAEEATNFGIQVQLDSTTVDFIDGFLKFEPSTTVSFTLTAPNRLKFNLAYPAEAAHKHYYDQTPIAYNQSSPDYMNYKANSMGTAYMTGSLRVYVNGVRISSTDGVYVPGSLVTDAWTLLRYTTDPNNGIFALSVALSPDDVIRIDYDTSYL